jgi:hypothetical protein
MAILKFPKYGRVCTLSMTKLISARNITAATGFASTTNLAQLKRPHQKAFKTSSALF